MVKLSGPKGIYVRNQALLWSQFPLRKHTENQARRAGLLEPLTKMMTASPSFVPTDLLSLPTPPPTDATSISTAPTTADEEEFEALLVEAHKRETASLRERWGTPPPDFEDEEDMDDLDALRDLEGPARSGPTSLAGSSVPAGTSAMGSCALPLRFEALGSLHSF